MEPRPTDAPQDPPASTAACRIGVFDSGVGGLSVLRALRRDLPRAEFHYVADSAHAPYGERSEAYVIERSRALARFLIAQGAQLLVVACNTATAAAVAALRSDEPGRPIVGVEPGIKPAVARTRNGRIGVMATRGTLASDKFRRLMETHGTGTQVHLQACPGLAHAIEGGRLDDPALRARVEEHCAPLRALGVDTVVLGCTHYPFAAGLIQQALGPEVVLIDTADAVSRRVRDLAQSLGSPPDLQPGAVHLWSSGPPDALSRIASLWLDPELQARALPPGLD